MATGVVAAAQEGSAFLRRGAGGEDRPYARIGPEEFRSEVNVRGSQERRHALKNRPV
jgi:hypothetical protein